MAKNPHQRAAGVLRVGEAIALIAIVWAIAPGDNALAQIKPDGTLGAEGSAVTENVMINGGLADRINGGATRGANLFHSFEQFNISDGQRVYFANPVGIENIFSRVRGTHPSDIRGTLGVEGGANLFFLNPNGIIFGENAALDVRGSFVATTANAIQFGNQGFFSASTPEVSPLLTINPSAFFFNQIISGRIENRSITSAGVNLLGESLKGLRVPDGQSLLLVGGDIALAGGGLNALGGRVELVGLAAPSTVALNRDGNRFSLSVPEGVARGDISLTNQGVISTSGEGGGEIQVWGKRVTLTEGSQIVGTTLGSQAGGGLTVDASESVELIGTGFENFERTFIAGGLSGQLRPFNPGTGLFTGTVGAGAAGAIAINTKQLILRDGAIVFSPTLSQGAGGSLTVRATESVEAIGSGLLTLTVSGATGAAGEIAIDTKGLIVRDGSVIATTTLGEGAGGEIVVRASEFVEVLGTLPETLVATGLFTSTLGGTGAAGGMTIETGRLIVRGAAQIATQSGAVALGLADGGRGGDLDIIASEFIKVSDPPKDKDVLNGLLSGTEGSGQGGNLRISTPLFRVSQGFILASTSGTGDSGDVTIDTGVLIVQEGGIIAASSAFGEGDSGQLTITASESVQLIGKSADGQIPSGLFTDTKIRGNAGDITIDTPLFLVQDGARVSAETSAGAGGSITLTADKVELINNGQIRTTTAGHENAGDIILKVQESVFLAGADSGLFANTEINSSGNGGSIFINNPTSVLIRDGATVVVDSQGTGEGGSIEISSDSLTLDNQASLSAETTSNTGGDITLLLNDLLLMRRGSRISTTAGTEQGGGDGGNITINANFIVAVPNENSDITANAFPDRGDELPSQPKVCIILQSAVVKRYKLYLAPMT
jgi:filamentous hemagglutinin family protein